MVLLVVAKYATGSGGDAEVDNVDGQEKEMKGSKDLMCTALPWGGLYSMLLNPKRFDVVTSYGFQGHFSAVENDTCVKENVIPDVVAPIKKREPLKVLSPDEFKKKVLGPGEAQEVEATNGAEKETGDNVLVSTDKSNETNSISSGGSSNGGQQSHGSNNGDDGGGASSSSNSGSSSSSDSSSSSSDSSGSSSGSSSSSSSSSISSSSSSNNNNNNDGSTVSTESEPTADDKSKVQDQVDDELSAEESRLQQERLREANEEYAAEEQQHKEVKAAIKQVIEGEERSKEEDWEEAQNNGQRMNFASLDAGAVILGHSKAMEKTSSLLIDDRDKYALAACDLDTHWVTIGLSEEIEPHEIELHNYERYSSIVRKFQVLGGNANLPTTKWTLLGEFEAEEKLGVQTFTIETKAWVRSIKLRFLSYYGNEYYCTLTEVRVFGSTDQFEKIHIDFDEKNTEVERLKQTIDNAVVEEPRDASAPVELPEQQAAPEYMVHAFRKSCNRSMLVDIKAASICPEDYVAMGNVDSHQLCGLYHQCAQDLPRVVAFQVAPGSCNDGFQESARLEFADSEATICTQISKANVLFEKLIFEPGLSATNETCVHIPPLEVSICDLREEQQPEEEVGGENEEQVDGEKDMIEQEQDQDGASMQENQIQEKDAQPKESKMPNDQGATIQREEPPVIADSLERTEGVEGVDLEGTAEVEEIEAQGVEAQGTEVEPQLRLEPDLEPEAVKSEISETAKLETVKPEIVVPEKGKPETEKEESTPAPPPKKAEQTSESSSAATTATAAAAAATSSTTTAAAAAATTTTTTTTTNRQTTRPSGNKNSLESIFKSLTDKIMAIEIDQSLFKKYLEEANKWYAPAIRDLQEDQEKTETAQAELAATVTTLQERQDEAGKTLQGLEQLLQDFETLTVRNSVLEKQLGDLLLLCLLSLTLSVLSIGCLCYRGMETTHPVVYRFL